jgi:esterase
MPEKKLFVRTLGKGPALIILHGLYGMSDNWLHIARSLSSAFSVYIPDLRNHGKSPHFDSHTYDDMSDDLIGLMDDYRIVRPILLGHSMGGKVAMKFASKYPDMTGGLIVADIAPKNYSVIKSHGNDHSKILDLLFGLKKVPVPTRKDSEIQILGATGDERLTGFLLKNISRNSEGFFEPGLNIELLRNKFSEISDGFPADDWKEPITGFPVLFVRGSESNYITDQDVPVIREVFPQASVESIENAGHWLHSEQPEAFIRTVKDFLGVR